MPPIAGKILWVRQLFRRINEPINYFFVSQSYDLYMERGGVGTKLHYKCILSYSIDANEVVRTNAFTKRGKKADLKKCQREGLRQSFQVWWTKLFNYSWQILHLLITEGTL